MSRSIHTTRRTLGELVEKKFASSEEQLDAIKAAGTKLKRKRLIKRQVLAERRRSQPPLDGSAICTIPIRVRDAGRWVHHAASEDDIRSVLAGLPGGATEGVLRIDLCLASEYLREYDQQDTSPPDPLVGRKSVQILPRVYAGPVLGTYTPRSGAITVHAFVYDPGHLPMLRPLCEVYLRLQALRTLVHEVAHYHDGRQRVGRGRWRADSVNQMEWYAEKMEHQWTQEVVIPYIQKTYPGECQALRKWVAHRGGWMPPLSFFAGDKRSTLRNGFIRLVTSTSDAFQEWVGEMPPLPTLRDSRLAFAWKLYYTDLYEECLGILNPLLQLEPTHVPSLNCKAQALGCLDRWDEVLICVEQTLCLDPSNAEAWEQRGNVFLQRDDWPKLLENCTRWEAAGRMKRPALRAMWRDRAVAHCGLGDEAEMERCVRFHLETFNFRTAASEKRVTFHARRTIYRLAGKAYPANLAVVPARWD
ncbi:MAG TPA: hypothetical protein VMF06_20815 [Candidatus Limnocylindria bacterium]|nr:hypothetical protein [Candidatus Limnocylindria bacterium]